MIEGKFFEMHSDWRWHGLGMLQRELPGSSGVTRVHVWHPNLIRVPMENFRRVHDHRFDITSLVIFGKITDVHYDVQHARSPILGPIKGDGRPENVANTKMWAITHAKVQTGDDVREIADVYAERAWSAPRVAGNIYSISRRNFHMTEVNALALTVVTRSNFLESGPIGNARVLGDTAHSAIAGNHGPIPRDDEVIYDVLHEVRVRLAAL